MDAVIALGLVAAVGGGLIWLYIKASRSINAQRGNRLMRRNHNERNAIRESNLRMGNGGFGGGGMT